MDLSTFRYFEAGGSPAFYWRRRVLVLAAGLAVLAVVAWTFASVLSSGATAASAGTGRGPAAGAAGSGPGGPGGPGGTGGPGRRPAPGAAASSSPARPASPAPVTPSSPAARVPQRASRPGAPARSRPAPAAAKLPVCRRRYVVLTLSARPAPAGAHGLPGFSVSVVSTAAGTCRFNTGVRYLALVVAAGKTRVFDSADCVRGPGAAFTVLHRGVPVTVARSWDGRRSAPGCPPGQPLARAGRYTATAVHEALVSNAEPVRIG